MITLTGKTLTREVEPKVGATLLQLAQEAGVDWLFNCSRGTCARCRCLIREGAERLEEATDAEWDRLGPDELDEGFRLGCQAKIASPGRISAVNRTYF
ncbi:2Fe-2S iron-sulfur cluster-binding protein [Cohnella sp. REN36]|uniref:2Fe-2S iron-sulfur cluster-binding protein n=1 Tax=Cohnella sp. REN36 TaxID=2887347 RepID=UPI001D159A25|nr:2Fe-2S iron-sulfur cluster-binding protein [Cohnella sp. REN36]MCC3373501.1 (2Fe-2S)-binding protein [Cohnella sp. REN36]